MCESRRKFVRLAVFLLATAATSGNVVAAPAASTAKFMERVRTPFLESRVGRAEGEIQHRGTPEVPRRLPVTVTFRFGAAEARATATLGGSAPYAFVWRHGQAGSARIEEHPDDPPATVEQLGLRAEDLTFSFLFWEVVEEGEREVIAGQPCRVIRLRDPADGGAVLGWFSEKFLFPLRLEWSRPGERDPWRVCEFNRFGKLDDGTWFLRAMRLYGQGWKTKLTLDEVVLGEE